MKRAISLVLTVVMLLGLLPATAFAGGGGASQIWSENFNEGLPEDWIVIDANYDGYSFSWNGEGYVQSGVVTGMGLLPSEPQAGEDYLISPVITLQGDEEVLSYEVRVPENGADVLFDVFVCPGYTILNADTVRSLRNPIVQDACYSWAYGETWQSRTLDLTAFAGQPVRLVIRQRAQQAGCVLMLDNFSVYWNEPDEIMDKVTAFNLPEPRAGKKVSDCKESDISFPAFANYELIPGSLTYYRIEDELVHEFTGTFAAGEEYTISFEVMVKPGNTVSETGIASVNGKWARFISETAEVAMVEMYCGRLGGEVQSVDVTVAPPLAGRNPTTQATVNNPEQCTVEELGYLHYEGEDNYSLLYGSDYFEASEPYRIMVWLMPAEGWTLSGDVAVRINGVKASYDGPYNGGGLFYVDVTSWETPFLDVKLSDWWFAEAVSFCFYSGLMAGTGDGTVFSPKMSFSRAMFVTVLARIDGSDTSPYAGVSHFSDVKTSKWYAAPVEWAYANSFAGGTGNGKFSPEEAVTRETLAVFLYNYTQKKFGALDDEDWVELSAYPDGDQVSSWARSAMRWAVYNGLISGVPGDGEWLYLKPKKTASRAEVAIIVMNFSHYLWNFVGGDD
jgi:hypothetical protein